jgi:hypothetical protein
VESAVLLLILLLVFLALTVFFVVVTLFLQGYFYTEPIGGVAWRAPAAAAALTAWFALWSYLDYRSPGSYDALHLFSPRVDQPRPKELWSLTQGHKSKFELRKSAGLGGPQEEYRDAETNKPWRRSEAVIFIDGDGQEVRFDADRDAQGNYKIERTKAPTGLQWLVGPGTELPLRYRDSRGRVMTEDAIGQLSATRGGLLLGNLLLNLVHFLLWFVGFWLLLRFQWAQSLLLAIVLWLVVTIPLLPMLLGYASELGTQRKSAGAAVAPAAAQVVARMGMLSPPVIP